MSRDGFFKFVEGEGLLPKGLPPLVFIYGLSVHEDRYLHDPTEFNTIFTVPDP